MTGATRSSHDRPIRRKQADSGLEERIERLEERLEESILGDDGLAAVDQGTDRQGDTLKRAARHSRVERGSRKA